MKKEEIKQVSDFEATIQEHENQLFGIALFNEGIKCLYKNNQAILETTAFHFMQTMERGEKAISEAKKLVEEVKKGSENIDVLRTFEFPPIHGPGLDEMTQRATLLVKAFERLFPEKPRILPLTEEEHLQLMCEVVENWEGE